MEIKIRIQELTSYEEGLLPFRYLGVPLTAKKLNINHYMPLIDKILNRVRHWTYKLLSMTGRIQPVHCHCHCSILDAVPPHS